MMITETCENCYFSRTVNQGLCCRRFPPQIQHMMVPGKIAGTMIPQTLYSVPVVPLDSWCGEWTNNMNRLGEN